MTPPLLEGQRVLVTGGAGFIGSHIVDRLVPDNEIVVLDNLSSGNTDRVDDGVTLIEDDIRNSEVVVDAIMDVDVVFHEAANISVEQSVERPVESHEVNIDGTLNVLEAARAEDASVVLASSAAIYGHPERVPIREDDLKQPSSPYGLEKLTIDHYARLYHELYGLETVALRYFNVYGPRQSGGSYSGVIDIFLEQAQAGRPITIEGDGTQTRDFVHVHDVVDANLLAARNASNGEAYNVGTGNETTILELAETIRRMTESEAPIEHIAPRTGDIEASQADITKAKNELDYEPKISLTTGLRTLT